MTRFAFASRFTRLRNLVKRISFLAAHPTPFCKDFLEGKCPRNPCTFMIHPKLQHPVVPRLSAIGFEIEKYKCVNNETVQTDQTDKTVQTENKVELTSLDNIDETFVSVSVYKSLRKYASLVDRTVTTLTIKELYDLYITCERFDLINKDVLKSHLVARLRTFRLKDHNTNIRPSNIIPGQEAFVIQIGPKTNVMSLELCTPSATKCVCGSDWSGCEKVQCHSQTKCTHCGVYSLYYKPCHVSCPCGRILKYGTPLCHRVEIIKQNTSRTAANYTKNFYITIDGLVDILKRFGCEPTIYMDKLFKDFGIVVAEYSRIDI
jgi:hypothetical protein